MRVRTQKQIVTQRGRSRPVGTLNRAQFRAITKAISDPTRYEILQHIARADECTCADLREGSPIGAATLSHHLKELEAAGLITITRRGKFALPCFRREVWKTYIGQLSEL
jgi:ArsR family transcriptional regulator